MTMQVGMVGTDGIILASDTKFAGTGALRTTFASSKIKISESRRIAIACARNAETSSWIAARVIAELTEEQWLCPISPIEEIARSVLSASAQRNDAHCLIVAIKPYPRLFLLRTGMVNGEWGPNCLLINDKAIAGDDANPAQYWIERYYRPDSIRSLALLAATVVGTSAKLNSGAISGLEVVLCEQSGFRRLSDQSIRQLEIATDEIDKTLDASFRRAQQFTYAPSVLG